MVKELSCDTLRNFCSEEKITALDRIKQTKEHEIIGQSRAEKALLFGLTIKTKGYNIYLSGAPGTGKTTFAKEFAEKVAKNEKTPPDLCYIYNFDNPKCPKLLKLPHGMGKTFQEDMEELIDTLLAELPKEFSNREYEAEKNEIMKGYTEKRDDIIKKITDEAKEEKFGVKMTSTGIYFVPEVEGEMISEEQFDALSDEQKSAITESSESIQLKASEVMRAMRDYERGTKDEIDRLDYNIALFTVGRYIGKLQQEYLEQNDVLKYLAKVKEDILDNIEDFVEEETEEEEATFQNLLPWYTKKSREDNFSKYKVNLIVDHSATNGAPVILEYNPTYTNLIGEIEYDNEFGNFTTDFMKIKPGVFHKANGGYLIVQAHDVLTHTHSWETIRRVLRTGEIAIEPLREYSAIAVSCIRPEELELELKLLIVGTSYYYELIYEYDDEFQKLFKINAQFDYEMSNNDENIVHVINFVRRFEEYEGCAKFEPVAIARIIEYSSRLAERQNKLTTRFGKLSEILSEAAAWAKIDGLDSISGESIGKAIHEKEQRAGLYEEKLTDMIEDGTIMIDTTGKKTGQINGLAVLEMDDYIFAKPVRITATTYVGKAGIINIEKEAEMSGSIHDKGIQVLIGYLGQIYAQEFPLSLSCRICFEQNYNGIDGDSASSTELYSVLSSLTELPINQEIAVTGSMNQRGEIQPIGGVTYKIEGFFDLCAKRGLTGTQGVIIPMQNIGDLVLKDSVINAVSEGLFHIYAITHVDEGIEILTGIKAGEKNEKGKYPPETVHGKVMKKLKEFSKKAVTE